MVKEKLQDLIKLANKHSVTILGECHDLFADIQRALVAFQQSYFIFHSSCEFANGVADGNSGGLLFLVAKSHFVGWCCEVEVLVPGRVAYLRAVRHFEKQLQEYRCYGAHNHNLANAQMRKVTTNLRDSAGRCSANPHCNVVVLTGDFNLPPPYSETLKLDLPDRVQISKTGKGRENLTHVPNVKPNQREWEEIFAPFTEIQQKEHNHVNISSLTSSGLNRFFFSLPPSESINLAHANGSVNDPISWYTADKSDHSPIYLSNRIKTNKPNTKRRLHACWCKHPLFKKLTENVGGIGPICLG